MNVLNCKVANKNICTYGYIISKNYRFLRISFIIKTR
ncbi:hypothetical protein EUBDOL_01051 [Amedibacillus dolichus DSM 3991]|uniref:Uncharacterized protein n=1 Tax=Amedibacillus dolichus DSM 3991 TaxID=428127 RepID=A8RBC6_9FIRM|nr:hypothetical protein EUBDOL_01051 [Amedibacillus dolichus DSM 3991]